jgi:glucose-6-phosphate 1-dehydrogenase
MYRMAKTNAPVAPRSTNKANEAGRPAAPDPCLMVIFGANGDLTSRLVVPALYNMRKSGLLSENFAVIGVNHGTDSDAIWKRNLRKSMDSYVANSSSEASLNKIDEEAWAWLTKRMTNVLGEFGDNDTYARLAVAMDAVGAKNRTAGNALFYLATPERFFGDVIEHLKKADLLEEDTANAGWRRVVIEKPFGHDLPSAIALNARVQQSLREEQIYRIDHFLGKETVQNILAFRFANGLFEPIWHRDRIDHVQITVAETVGVEARGSFYEQTGCLRDMVPNHLFQLVAMVAMEPPSSFAAEAVRQRKAEAIDAIRPVRVEDAVRGQYGPGAVNGDLARSYRDEPNVAGDSPTETYVAMKVAIDTWRWAGVPFYLRTGKHLARRTTEIAIRFKSAPFAPFRGTNMDAFGPDWLVLQIQPNEGISLQFDVKRPGPKMELAPVRMDFHYADWFPSHANVGYETLLYDVMTGDATLFQRADMVEASWRAVQPLLEAWSARTPSEFPNYASGSAGPAAADTLLALSGGHTWRPLAAQKPPRARKVVPAVAKKTSARKVAGKKAVKKTAVVTTTPAVRAPTKKATAKKSAPKKTAPAKVATGRAVAKVATSKTGARKTVKKRTRAVTRR